ncbi:MAG: hypothetical protein VST64_04420 [Nitrospirota bacterium]|jgi:hypothetical protein|nr:hypothetical protein [Nitrospirota bacterium]
MKYHIMDRSGHTTEVFDTADKVSMEEAEKRFTELTGHGFRAAENKGGGKHEVVKSFNPDAEETIFVPLLAGG